MSYFVEQNEHSKTHGARFIERTGITELKKELFEK